MIRILNAEAGGYCDEARQILHTIGDLREGEFTRQALLPALADVDVLIVRLGHQVDAALLDAAPRLQAIVSATTGLDHIDLHNAAARGVTVLSLRGETAFLRSVRATAEHTWALLLGLVRHLPAAFAHVQAGGWDRDQFRGHELYGRRLGILGLGRLGEKVARYGQAFGMPVLGYDPFRSDWEPGVERCRTLTELLTQSDVLSVHLPLNDETVGFLGAAELALLPAGALLVNTARGAIIDEKALVAALRSGHLAGAAVDVIAAERQTDGHKHSPLIAYARNHDNCLITPHIAGATFESMANTEIFMAKKLQAFLEQMGMPEGGD